jgi:hypothetical protein
MKSPLVISLQLIATTCFAASPASASPDTRFWLDAPGPGHPSHRKNTQLLMIDLEITQNKEPLFKIDLYSAPPSFFPLDSKKTNGFVLPYKVPILKQLIDGPGKGYRDLNIE